MRLFLKITNIMEKLYTSLMEKLENIVDGPAISITDAAISAPIVTCKKEERQDLYPDTNSSESFQG